MKFLIPLILSTLIFMSSLIYIITANFRGSATYLEAALITFVIFGMLMMALALVYIIRIIKD